MEGVVMASFRAKLHRRDFLTVGAAGLGLNLVDYLAIRQAQAAENAFETPPVVAESVIHIFLPGGCRRRSRSTPSRSPRSNTAAS